MCGIAGLFAYHYAANSIDRRELARINARQAARGPDGAGDWHSADGRVGLAHRRLSIIDLSTTGHQPMAGADGRLVVTFNGEIYNYRELRRGLERRGYVFQSQSDTEVLLHLYADRGEAMVEDLRGMFAFAIWDARQRTLFFARDPLGIKPLYYANDGWTFRFASQVKALVAGGAISHEEEPAGWAGFYLLGSVPEPLTTFRDIRALEAGTTLLVDRLGPAAPRRYFSVAKAYCDAELATGTAPSSGTAAEHVRAALLDSVRHHLVADVPVGAFLSAGIDSGALVGLMRDAGQARIRTVTLAFEEWQGRADDEAPLAAEVARHYETEHTTRVVTEREFTADLPLILEAMDQPTIDGINTWFVSKAARELGLKVAISGLGGDELLGGYPSFRDVPRWVRLLAAPSRVPGLGRAIREAMQALGSRLPGISPKAQGLVELGGSYAGAYLLRRGLFMPWELEQMMPRETAREGLRRLDPLVRIDAMLTPRPKSAFARVATLETSLYMRNQLLRDTDWASMAHGLEVRVPLVDHVLLTQVAPWTARPSAINGKAALAESPQRSLPNVITARAKTGFTTPVGAWLQQSPLLRPFHRVPLLAGDGCPWARRWAYGIAVPKAAA